MKKAISCLTALTVCAAALAGCSSGASPAGQGAILNFGTGAVGGTDNTVVEAISSVVNQNTSLRTSTVTTNGGAEIIYRRHPGGLCRHHRPGERSGRGGDL